MFEGIIFWLLPIMIWEAVWKGIGLWNAGKNKHLAWFVCMFIFNTAGILPIIYVFLFAKRKKARVRKRKRK